jgi:hypothetical protein
MTLREMPIALSAARYSLSVPPEPMPAVDSEIRRDRALNSLSNFSNLPGHYRNHKPDNGR